MKVLDVENKGNILVAQILETKINLPRKFVITNGEEKENWIKVV